MTKFITEILAEINKEPSKINLYKDNFTVKTLLEYSFDPEKVFLLPEGKPPFKPDAAPIGMSPSNLFQQIKKLYVFTRPDVSKLRLEQLFIQLLESIHPSEAELIIAVKDKELGKLYPNITKQLLIEVGILNAEMFQSTDSEPVVEGKGKNLVLNLSDTATTEESFGNKFPKTEEAPVPFVRSDLEKMTKEQIGNLGDEQGIQLDRRKKKKAMIDDFFNYIEDDGK